LSHNRRERQDGVMLCKEPTHQRLIPHITTHKLERSVIAIAQQAGLTMHQTVDHRDDKPATKQAFDKHGADVARASKYQNPLRHYFLVNV
jgi:hypothetical protein